MGSKVKFFVAILVAIAGVVSLNAVRVNSSASDAHEFQKDISTLAYYRFGVVPDSIVFDLWEIDGLTSQAEVLGIFLRFAEEMKEREFREVRLAYRGETRFILDGEDFNNIGKELAFQNPIYIVRTFPEKLSTPDGKKAFSTWTGGLLGVVGKQMEDVNKLGERWYLDDMRAR